MAPPGQLRTKLLRVIRLSQSAGRCISPLSHRALSARGRRRSGLNREEMLLATACASKKGKVRCSKSRPLHKTITPLEIQSFHLRPDDGHQFRHFLIEPVRHEVDYILVGLVISNSSTDKLRQHLVREGTRHLEGQMARGES